MVRSSRTTVKKGKHGEEKHISSLQILKVRNKTSDNYQRHSINLCSYQYCTRAPISVAPPFPFYRWRNCAWEVLLLQGDTVQPLTLHQAVVPIPSLQYVCCDCLTWTQADTAQAIICLVFSAWLTPPSVPFQESHQGPISLHAWCQPCSQVPGLLPGKDTLKGQAVLFNSQIKVSASAEQRESNVHGILGGNFICSYIRWMSVSYSRHLLFQTQGSLCPKSSLLWPETKLHLLGR